MARERAWLLRAEAGHEVPAVSAGGRDWAGLVLDVDATLVEAHSEKPGAAAHFKGRFGFHPSLVWLDTPTRHWPVSCGPGNAGANTAADHITVIDAARAQPRRAYLRHPDPDPRRRGRLLRTVAGAPGCPARRPRPGRVVLGRIHHDRAGADRDLGPAAVAWSRRSKPMDRRARAPRWPS